MLLPVVEEECVTTQMQEVMIHIRKIATVLAFVYVFVVPSYGKMDDVEEIKNVVKMYNRIVIEESKNDRHRDIRTFIKMMEEIATHDIARKLYIWIQSWHENGLFMNARLENLSFEQVDVKDGKAEVTTKENWIYNYFDRRIGKEVLSDREIFYRVKYTLKKVKNRWLLFRIKVLEEKQKKTNQEEKR